MYMPIAKFDDPHNNYTDQTMRTSYYSLNSLSCIISSPKIVLLVFFPNVAYFLHTLKFDHPLNNSNCPYFFFSTYEDNLNNF